MFMSHTRINQCPPLCARALCFRPRRAYGVVGWVFQLQCGAPESSLGASMRRAGRFRLVTMRSAESRGGS